MRHKLVGWKTYLKNLEGWQDFCAKTNGDWAAAFVGDEGAGKSTLAIQTAREVDKDFDIEEQIANNLKELLDLTRKYQNTPYKVILYDEAVRMAFSKEHAKRMNVLLTKILISNRSFQQFHFFTIPNVWYLNNYIREFRLRNLVYTYIDPIDYANTRWFGFYSRKNYETMITSPKARKNTIYRQSLFDNFPPNFICQFKPLEKDILKKYERKKREGQLELLDEVEDEINKLEKAGKLGFNKKTNPGVFLEFLKSRYENMDDLGKEFLTFTYEQVARDVTIKKELVVDLVNKLLDKKYIEKAGRTNYTITTSGLKLMGLLKNE